MKTNKIFISIATTVVTFFMFFWTTDACKSQPTTTIYPTTMDALFCNTNKNCLDNEVCLESICTEACDIARSFVASNALCTSSNHNAHWSCPENYTGSPFLRCIKPCTKNVDCPDTDKCKYNKCLPGCEFIQCEPNGNCLTVNHKSRCYSKKPKV